VTPPGDGYFSAESAIRRIGGESVLMLGGGRALLMQAAHPLVAAGIVQHSDYRARTWQRLARTMSALYTIVFGTRPEADRAGEAVQAVHASVHGRLATAVGAFEAGTPYSASDPELMMWVHATLVDTGLVMHEAYVAPLSRADREAFYRDMTVVARVFGIPVRVIPRTLREFEAYRRERLEGSELCVGADARAVAASVLDPPVPSLARPVLRSLNLATVGLLPPPLREKYDLAWSRADELAFRMSARFTRTVVVPLLPKPLRVVASPRRRDGGVPLRVLTAFAGMR
jgi:uncharacterized protein (DUF2236 family)